MSDEELPMCMQGGIRIESLQSDAVTCDAYLALEAEIDRLRGVIVRMEEPMLLPIESCNNPECWCHHWNHLSDEPQRND